eukprot:TRINITY_DN75714_c0_g1_i1.p1 TRINITY_DN75714_c0_g1~~TRINITY_DN75714_c0_g1_i1.p1  ORF type:complete len:373 (-),score=59.73 TRINITY_DN75714_c0_g1_i1:154-1149(-)
MECEHEPEEEQECCAICFETAPFVELPCQCNIKYCSSCWDRALATSVTTLGRAQCPSCRSPFKVDFDPEKRTLVFASHPEGTPAADWRSLLYAKAREVQINLLEAYGSAAQEAGITEPCASGDSECLDLPKMCRDVSSGSAVSSLAGASTCDGLSDSSQLVPRCVCGGELEYISSRTRIYRLLNDMEPGWRSRISNDPDELVDRLLASALVTCDLCDGVAIKSKGVWTCKHGPHTVMHPAAYDVCEACFGKHSGLFAKEPSAAAEKAAKRGIPLSLNPSRMTEGCGNACSAMLLALGQQRRRSLQAVQAAAAGVASAALGPRGRHASHAET